LALYLAARRDAAARPDSPGTERQGSPSLALRFFQINQQELTIFATQLPLLGFRQRQKQREDNDQNGRTIS
jgi:hypothetical protein